MIWTLYLAGIAAFLLAATWDAHGRTDRRWDPVAIRVVSDWHLTPTGWALGVAIIALATTGIVLLWRFAMIVGSAGIVRRRVHVRRIDWAEVTDARVVLGARRSRVRFTAGPAPVFVPFPAIRRARAIVAVQRALDNAPHGVWVDITGLTGDLAARQLAHDVDVKLGLKPTTAPRPRMTRRQLIGTIVFFATTLMVSIPLGIWVAQKRAERLEEERRPIPQPVDIGTLSGLLEPELNSVDAGARTTAEQALGALRGATMSIDCDGRIPTEGGLAGVRYVSVRTAAGLWEATPAVAPTTASTTWRLADLEDSGVFASTGPLPEPSARWEIKVNTYLGPAWFGCKPVNRPAP